MPKRIDSADQLSAAARRCRTAGRRTGRHDWPDLEEMSRTDRIVTASRGGKPIEVKLILPCKRGCGTTQETFFELRWHGENVTVIAVNEKPIVKYDDFYLRKPGADNALDLDGIRTDRWRDAFPEIFGDGNKGKAKPKVKVRVRT